MRIDVINDKKDWLPGWETEFVQQWEWGDFQATLGHLPLRLTNGDEQWQGFIHDWGRGMKYWYAPRVDMTAEDLGAVGDFLKKKGFAFARVEPQVSREGEKGIEFVANRQPKQTWILDLSKTLEEILTGMHSKTRYNINLAQRKGVVVREEKNPQIFWELNKETVRRDSFRSHGYAHYEKLLAQPFVRQLIAYYQGRALASNIFILTPTVITYLHGASSSQERNLMAPYFLQWEGLKLGKKNGCQQYDFWGISPPAVSGPLSCFHGYCWSAGHSWTGVTRFKVSFGGQLKEYGQAFDQVLSPGKYKLYQWVR